MNDESNTGVNSGSMGSNTTGGIGVTHATDDGVCPTCGQSSSRNAGLEQFLGKLGISDDMISNLKTQFQNVDVDEYMNTARDFLKNGGAKASTYAKDNPGKVAAGVAAIAVGAGLLYASTKDR
jgi:hypothetical protein